MSAEHMAVTVLVPTEYLARVRILAERRRLPTARHNAPGHSAPGFGWGRFRVQSASVLTPRAHAHCATLRRMKYEILGLGPTETEVMEALWVHGPLTVKQVHAKIEAYRLIAYTTILTVSARMEEKGLITRHTNGADYNGARLLTPTVTRVELLTHAVVAVCDNLNASADDRAAVVAVLGNADA
jgi:predicted transcriptional regulator